MATNLKEVNDMASDLIEIMTGEENPELDVRIELPSARCRHVIKTVSSAD
jgi:hypothetical protein